MAGWTRIVAATAIVAGALALWRRFAGEVDADWRLPAFTCFAVAGLAVALWSLRREGSGARGLLATLTMALWGGAAVVLVAIVFDLGLRDTTGWFEAEPRWLSPWSWLGGGGFAAVVLASLGSRRRGALVSLSLAVAAATAVAALVGYQELDLGRVKVRWRDRGWPVERSDLLPASIDRDCAGWHETLLVVGSKLSSASGAWDTAVCAIGSGEHFVAAMRTSLAADSASLDRWSRDVVAAMAGCSRLEPWNWDERVGRRALFSIGRWSEVAAVRALSHAVLGERDEASSLSRAIATAAERLRVPGHPLVDALFAISIEKRAAIVEVATLAAMGPGDASDHAWLVQRSRAELDWLRTTADAERSFAYEECSRDPEELVPDAQVAVELGRPPESPWWRLGLLKRIRRFPACHSALTNVETFRQWLEDPAGVDGFRWSEAMELERPYLNLYQRAGELLAMWRVALAVDIVLRDAAERGELSPDGAALRDWPADPFDGEPLRYRRVANQRFVVYSVGSDGIDGAGADLAFDHRTSVPMPDIGVNLVLP